MNSPQNAALADVEAVLERRAEACRTKDIDLLMSLYAAEIVYFDVVPPLAFTGTDPVRQNFLRWFAEYTGAIELETHDLSITVGDDLAVASMLHRDTGDMTGDDSERSMWLRSTVCLRCRDGRWAITHEHISLPVDLATMDAVVAAGR